MPIIAEYFSIITQLIPVLLENTIKRQANVISPLRLLIIYFNIYINIFELGPYVALFYMLISIPSSCQCYYVRFFIILLLLVSASTSRIGRVSENLPYPWSNSLQSVSCTYSCRNCPSFSTSM
jgi:hypothetical protein